MTAKMCRQVKALVTHLQFDWLCQGYDDAGVVHIDCSCSFKKANDILQHRLLQGKKINEFCTKIPQATYSRGCRI
jgi:hypothetical protein